MVSRVTRKAREFGERLLQDDEEEATIEIEPTVAEERRKVIRIARHKYAAQLLPWKIFFGLLVASLYVNGEHWSPWGVLPWMFALVVASFLVTEWRLGGRHVKSGRIDWGNPRGRKQQRIRRRALRSAVMGACAGLWLIVVTLTDPSHRAGQLVWLAGAGLWATFSYHGWWQHAEMAYDTPAALPADEDTDDDPASDPWPDAAAVPAPPAPPRRRRSGGVPVPRVTAAQATAAAVVEEERAQVPNISLLKTAAALSTQVDPHDDLTTAIQAKLDELGLKAKVVEAVRAPAITRYGIEPEPGQQVDAIIRRKRDFALACGTERVVMKAPIEGRPLVGIEVPNKERGWVTLGEVLASAAMQHDYHPLTVVIGKDHDGEYLTGNLRKMPHVLVGGETGGGKSGGIDTMIVTILLRATPDEVKFIFVDVKRVELTRYQGIPHLIFPVITEAERAAAALQWVIDETDRRYDEMARAGVRDIDDLNAKIIDGTHTAPPGAGYTMRPLPYLVVVVDETADLLMRDDGDEIEDAIVRLTQLARAAGIHLVLATQNPVVDVLTGKIKANVPSRMAYRTSSLAASRVIIDEPGAEKLLGKGDLLVRFSGMAVTIRVQGARVDEDEVKAVVNYWKEEAARKGLTIPKITLSAAPREDKPAQPRVTAYDSVLAAAVRLADHDRRVTKEQIIGATRGLTESARNNALTRLFDDEVLGKVKGQQAVYIVLRASKDEPPNQEEEPQ
jgi:DNA segregation ATPase FtsK/SpoIIIE-like protein